MTNTKFPILVFLLLFWATSVLAEADLASQDVTIFGKAVSSSQLDFEGPVEFHVVGDRLVVRTGSPRDKEAKIAVYDGATMEELWSVTGPWQFYSTGYGRPSLVLSEIVSEGFANNRVYDLEGELLFSKDWFDGTLYSSPGGDYFYTDFAGVHFNRFLVLDRQGETQGWRQPIGSPWTAAAFNDSIVVFATPTELQFISIVSGSTLVRVPVPPISSETRAEPKIYESPCGSRLLVDWNRRLVYISPAMTVDWVRPWSDVLDGVAFSEDGEYIGIFESTKTQGTLSFVQAKSGDLLWTETLDRGRFHPWHRGLPLMVIRDGFVTFAYPPYELHGRAFGQHEQLSSVFRYQEATGNYVGRTDFDGWVTVQRLEGQVRTIKFDRSKQGVLELKEWQDE